MARLVALLGGINVGGHRVTMDRLRTEMATLGYADVATFIASGNIVFTAAGRVVRGGEPHEHRISTHLAAALGWPVPTFVRPVKELIATVDLRPFGTVPAGHTHMVVFCRERPTAAIVDTLATACTERDTLEAHGREIHWLIRGGLMDSTLKLPKLAKDAGSNTTRNITSLARLADMVR